YAHKHKGMPLKPRTLLYPILKERILTSKWGAAADVFCIIGAAAGTIGPIGFLGLQVSYGVSSIFGLPDTFPTQLIVILVLLGVRLVRLDFLGYTSAMELVLFLAYWILSRHRSL